MSSSPRKKARDRKYNAKIPARKSAAERRRAGAVRTIAGAESRVIAGEKCRMIKGAAGRMTVDPGDRMVVDRMTVDARMIAAGQTSAAAEGRAVAVAGNRMSAGGGGQAIVVLRTLRNAVLGDKAIAVARGKMAVAVETRMRKVRAGVYDAVVSPASHS